ncbi:MAG: 30S ribosomal protein S13 [Alphaproteobacteria bacterium]|nr:30S ribosomal protein S13 [Alphaproteobacteria bacterium]MBL0718186.1 30S ribosomal protein S13 [Alphaproteobacteria bacterium]
MVRIAGNNLPDNKPIAYGLTYIFGVGLTTSNKICKELNLETSSRMKDLSQVQIEQITRYIEENKIIIEGDLRRKVSMDIKALQDIGCYRGIRHTRRLPVRGQNTRTNARTRKGKSSAVAGASKKGK